MKPVSETIHRALAYLMHLHSQDQGISKVRLDAFFDLEEPTRRVRELELQDLVANYNSAFLTGMSGLRGLARGRKIGESSFTDYALKVGWLQKPNPAQTYKLSRLGVAFATALNAPKTLEDSGGYAEVVVRPDDQFAYLKILDVFANSGPGLLVDAYLKQKQFIEIAEATQVDRFLVGDKAFGRGKDALTGRKMMQLALGVAAGPEMRISEDLHDRFFIPDAPGHIWMLGISLNGTAKNFSVLTKLEGESAAAIRGIVEDKWAAAEELKPERGKEEPGAIEEGSGPPQPAGPAG